MQRKAVGIVHAPWTCVLCRRVGACVREGIRALRAGCIPSPEPKPASGLGDSASMLSPKGDHDREVGRASDLWGLNREPWARGRTEVGRSATLGQAEPDSRRVISGKHKSPSGTARVPESVWQGIPTDIGRNKQDYATWEWRLYSLGLSDSIGNGGAWVADGERLSRWEKPDLPLMRGRWPDSRLRGTVLLICGGSREF